MILDKKKGLDIINTILFVISPFLAVFTILRSVCEKTRFSIVFYSFFVSYVSLLYLPAEEMDKMRHIEFYESLKGESLISWLIFQLDTSPDFLFNITLFIGSINDIKKGYIFFLITFITIFLVLKVFSHFSVNYLRNSSYSVFIGLLFLFSFSYIDVLSGMRYTLALSLVFYGFYFGTIENKKRYLFLSLLGVFTHFSVLFLVLVSFSCLFISKIDVSKLKLFLLFSFLFYLIPQIDFLLVFKNFGLNDALDQKVDAYIGKELQLDLGNSFGYYFIELTKNIWVYFLIILVFLDSSKNNVFHKNVILFLTFLNFFISFPLVYDRYLLFVKYICVFYILTSNSNFFSRKINVIFIFLFFYMIIFMNNLIVMRDGMSEVFFNIENWFLFNILI
ncbi:hypothetical protein EH230_02135 [Flavobacterium columnare]|uniref:EpsG family protein n=1 Tax=Flavobacterium columnare TaxID=996 RepID=A0A437UE12_9FLAO|nr:EpsG family protein [Flavobacterium columnare]RVU91799.1 hypothetical protein EH230_02135 [Flavobacterium columnare]